MATGITLYSDISGFVNNILEGSLLSLREGNVLAPTVSFFTADGMAPRKVYNWTTANFRAAGDGEDVTPTRFTKSLLNTLQPTRFADQYLLSDQEVASDWDNVRAAASEEMGGAVAEAVDSDIAGLFASLTGGTVGSAGGTLSWANILAAKAILRQAKVPMPYYCAVGEGHWYHLVANSGTAIANSFTRSLEFNTRLVDNYYLNTAIGGVVFVTSPNVSGAAGTAAYGAMYSPLAMALDVRRPYNIRPQRDESREAWELNYSMWYDAGVWAPLRGVQLIGTDVIA